MTIPYTRSSKAFTLLEMVAVLVLILVLAGIAVPTYQAVIGETRDSAAELSAKAYRDSIDSYAATQQVAPSALLEEALETPAGALASELPDGVTATVDAGTVLVCLDPPSDVRCAQIVLSDEVGGQSQVGPAPNDPGNGGGGGVAAPSAPTSLVATAGNAQVSLNWSVPVSGTPTSYKVYRSTSNSLAGATLVTTVGAATTDYLDTGVVNGTLYYFWVTAINGGGESTAASTSATPVLPVVLPSSPRNPYMTAQPATATVYWTQPTSGAATSYNIYRSFSMDFATASVDGSVSGSVFSYEVSGLTATPEFFWVTAVDANGESLPTPALSPYQMSLQIHTYSGQWLDAGAGQFGGSQVVGLARALGASAQNPLHSHFVAYHTPVNDTVAYVFTLGKRAGTSGFWDEMENSGASVIRTDGVWVPVNATASFTSAAYPGVTFHIRLVSAEESNASSDYAVKTNGSTIAFDMWTTGSLS